MIMLDILIGLFKQFFEKFFMSCSESIIDFVLMLGLGFYLGFGSVIGYFSNVLSWDVSNVQSLQSVDYDDSSDEEMDDSYVMWM